MQPILTINLSTGDIGSYTIPPDWQRQFLGGASLAARILYDFLKPELNPLSPEAPLLFMNGPLSGTSGPAVGRFVVCARSPHTGIWGESHCGGFWGPELRKAGFDGLWLTGRSPEPVYVWIKDQQVELRPASHLMGLDTYSTQAAVQHELGVTGASVAVIGPAGEKLVTFASILTDHGRMAGRTGMGAVMGSKNLKAITVKGTGKVPVNDLAAYSPLRSQANLDLRNEPIATTLRELGTAGIADYADYLGLMPKRYFHAAQYEHASDISGATIKESILTGISACHACVIACGRVVRLPAKDEQVPSLGEKRKGPEYETLVGFGPNLLLNDPVFVTRMGELCDRFGVDTISMSNTVGLAFCLFEKGIISTKDTGGIELNWGDEAAVEQVMNQAIHLEEFGSQLLGGARALGKRYGAEDEAIQVNGLEVAYHDPRGASGMALVYATSPRGACHNQSDYFFVDIGQVDPVLKIDYFSRHGGAEKAANVARHQDWRSLYNSLILCNFSNIAPEMVVSLVNAACGTAFSLEDLFLIGERGFNLKRVINHRLGLTRANDTLPKGLLEPLPDAVGEGEGFVPDIETMLKLYYIARGWDPETGVPTHETLEELGLRFTTQEAR